jgi:hypothetical protein
MIAGRGVVRGVAGTIAGPAGAAVARPLSGGWAFAGAIGRGVAVGGPAPAPDDLGAPPPGSFGFDGAAGGRAPADPDARVGATAVPGAFAPLALPPEGLGPAAGNGLDATRTTGAGERAATGEPAGSGGPNAIGEARPRTTASIVRSGVGCGM